MDLTLILLWSLVGIALLVAVASLFSRIAGKRIPRYPEPPPAPVKKYPLLVSELKTGGYYHCRLSHRLVKVEAITFNDPCADDFATGTFYSTVTQRYETRCFYDNDLYTTDINLAPREKADEQRRHDELVKAALSLDYTTRTEPAPHKWDDAGERCTVCGDKDWMGGGCSHPHQEPNCNGDTTPGAYADMNR